MLYEREISEQRPKYVFLNINLNKFGYFATCQTGSQKETHAASTTTCARTRA
jgi:hypothetical protein